MTDASGGLRWAGRAAMAATLILCVAPLAAAFLPLLGSPASTAAEAMDLLRSDRLWGLWGKTCGIAAATALVALMLGAPLGLLLGGLPPRTARWLGALLTLPLLLPAHVLAVAWIDLLGPLGVLNRLAATFALPPHPFPLYAPAGVILVQALSWYPVPLWAVWNGLRHIDPAVLDAARNLGTPGHTRRRVVLPLLVPAMATGALLVFLFSLLGFTVPSLLQVPVFTVEIYTSFNSLLDQRRAVLMALPLAAVGVVALGAAARLFRQSLREAPRSTARMIASTPRTRLQATVAVAILAATTGLPLTALLIRSLPPANFFGAAGTAVTELGTSLLLSGTGATLVVLIALALSGIGPQGQRWALRIAALAYLVSGPVLGVGLIQLWNRPSLPGLIYDHAAILTIAVAGRYLIFGLLGCRLALQWVPRDCVEAARNLGATPARTLARVALPLLSRPLFAVWAALALLIMGDVECIVLVAPPGWVPVSLRIFTLMHYGPAAMVSSLALIQASIAFALLAAAAWLVRPAAA